MVTEKNAVQRRKQEMDEFHKQEREKIERNTIKFRWYVIEHTPAYNSGGYYDQDFPAENKIVSKYFDTKQEAVAWEERHEADKGKKLIVKRDRLLTRSFTEWVSY